jgi:hypothetical protein
LNSRNFPFKKEFKKVVHNNYIQKTKDKLSKLTDNSKLYLYNKIKHDIVLEEYLIKEKKIIPCVEAFIMLRFINIKGFFN